VVVERQRERVGRRELGEDRRGGIDDRKRERLDARDRGRPAEDDDRARLDEDDRNADRPRRSLET